MLSSERVFASARSTFPPSRGGFRPHPVSRPRHRPLAIAIAAMLGAAMMPSAQAQCLSGQAGSSACDAGKTQVSPIAGVPKPAPETRLLDGEGQPLASIKADLPLSSPTSAALFVKGFVERAIELSENSSLSSQERVKALAGALQSDFDIETIGRLVLGEYWWSATPAQRAEYQRLFRSFMIDSYAAQFGSYSVETLSITGAEASKRKVVIVNTLVRRRGNQPVEVDWLVHHGSGAHRIIDIVVDGVSMALVQRFQFTSIIQSNGGRLESLLDALRQKLT